ncbi:MAG: C_GCAxxG_C_C family protein [Oscillospiraceae bacterium]|nr:C_GCAxxG_C_C family protein [Oscillospiraceae bacterium]
MNGHKEKARELFIKSYNCSQAVFGAFCDVTGMEEETALRLASSMGAGMGRMREVCGACSGMFMVCGLLYGYSDSSDDKAKAEHYALIQRMAAMFKEKHGTVICRELLAGLKTDTKPVPEARTEEYYKVRPCLKFVETAAEIMDIIIKEKSV